MSNTRLAAMRMIENLVSPEYAAGQIDDPEQTIPDPFAQFLPENDGILQSAKKLPKTGRKKAAAKKIISTVLQEIARSQGFVPQDKTRMSPQLPFNPGEASNLRQMTDLRADQDAGQRAFEQLEKNLTPMAMGIQALNLASPLGARGMVRPSNLSGPRSMPSPTPSAPLPPQMQPQGPIAPQNAPMMTGSGLSPRGDVNKFSPKGGMDYLRRQNLSANQKPAWVSEGANALLDKFLGMGQKKNPFLPNRRGLDMTVENLVNAGRKIPETRQDRMEMKAIRPEAAERGFTSMREFAEALELEALLGSPINKKQFDILKQSLKEEKMMNLNLNKHLRNKNREF